MTDLQKQLILCYYDCMDPKDIDGLWGPQSAQATRKLQQLMDIHDDGVWGRQTEEAVRQRFYSGDDTGPEMPEEEPETDDPELAARFKGIRYWSPEEFRCQCYGKYCDGFPALPDRTLLELVDDIRHEAGRPGHRSSGLRCQTHNDMQPGSVPNSRHIRGKALDFFVEGMSGPELLAAAQGDPRCRYAYIIQNGPYVHVDVE